MYPVAETQTPESSFLSFTLHLPEILMNHSTVVNKVRLLPTSRSIFHLLSQLSANHYTAHCHHCMAECFAFYNSNLGAPLFETLWQLPVALGCNSDSSLVSYPPLCPGLSALPMLQPCMRINYSLPLSLSQPKLFFR